MAAVLPFFGGVNTLLFVITVKWEMREEGGVVSDQTHPAPAEQEASLTELSATHKEDNAFSPATLRPLAHPLLMLYL